MENRRGETGMLETRNLTLDKAKQEDWAAMYRNVWSHWESAKYMMWSVTQCQEDAPERMRRTIEFQKSHNTYLVYLKVTGEAVGFAGVEQTSPTVWEEAGICLGPDYVGQGYGKQILQCLVDYAKSLGAEEFVCYAREQNAASRALIASLGFVQVGAEEKVDERDGSAYTNLKFHKTL